MVREIAMVACGGACGAMARYAVAALSNRWLTAGLPWGTFIVNTIGCFAIGVLAEYHRIKPLGIHWTLGVGIGFLGALTTFSTFAHETARLWEKGHSFHAVGNVAFNLVAGLIAVTLGIQFVRMLNP
jgi:CrcB protein